MSASPEVAARFDDWRRAYLVAHYAAPCPETVMNALVEEEYERKGRLSDQPAANADDMLLKLFPIILAEFEPRLVSCH